MGNRAYGSSQSSGGSASEVHDYVRALSNQQKTTAYQFLERLNPGGKVIKTCICKHKRYGKLTLAVYPKPVGMPPAEKDSKIQPILKQLENINARLNLLTHPGVVSHRLIDESKEALYFARQYFAFNVFDRFHVRPFFSNVDKHWIAYQLLQATQQLHASNIRHGGIKCENILVTTWNWLFVGDIAFYKPTYLPADNPSTYNYFFDAEKQRTTQPCYIAPERFYDSKVGAPIDHKLTTAMDIFSVGCCLAEIFLEGSVIFDYSQMLRYRTGNYSPLETLNKIKNSHVRNLIEHMIQLDPENRLTAKQYLGIEKCEGKIAESIAAVFPAYLHELYSLFTKLLDPSFGDPDSKIEYLHQHLDARLIGLIIKGDSGQSEEDGEEEGEAFASDGQILGTLPKDDSKRSTQSAARSRGNSPSRRDDSLEKIREMARFIESLGKPAKVDTKGHMQRSASSDEAQRITNPLVAADESSKRSQTPKMKESGSEALGVDRDGDLNGLAIIVAVVGACIQSLASPNNRIKALMILEKSVRKRSSILLTARSSDPHGIVRCKVVELLTFALERIDSIGFVDLNALNDFIMPIILKLHPDHERDPMVQITVCNLMPSLMQAVRRFLDMAHSLKGGGRRTNSGLEEATSYDKDLQAIKNNFLSLVVGLLAMGCSKAKIALLNNLLPVCEFLGKNLIVEKEMMMHLTTILNEQDWELRASMFRNLPQSAPYLGHKSFVADSLLPIMTEALYDAELFVCLEALKALKYLCCVANKADSAPWRIFGYKSRLKSEIVEKVAPLLLHPAAFIQKEACSFVAALASVAGPAQSHVLIHPILSKYTVHTVIILTYESLLEGLRPAIPRDQYDRAVDLYSKAPRGSVKMLLQLPYFANLHMDLVSDLYDYFVEVIKKSGSHLHRAAASPVRPPPPTLVETPGRDAVLYVAPTEPVAFAGFVERKRRKERLNSEGKGDTKSSRRERSSKSAGGDGNSERSSEPPMASLDAVQSAFEIPNIDENAGRIQSKKLFSSASLSSSGSAAQTSASALSGLTTDWYVRGVRTTLAEDEKVKPDMSNATWMPRGILVAEMRHRDAVNQVEVSEDSKFIASASKDGTIKIWNVSKLARVKDSFTLHADIEYRCGEDKDDVVGVAICEGTRRVAGVSKDGTIHVFTVDYGQNMRPIHDIRLDTKVNGMATTVAHAETLSKSLLLYGTHLGTVRSWDFRRHKEPFVLNLGEFMHDPGTNNFGVISTSTIGPEGYTFFVGTSGGFVILWDLRYQLATSIWHHSSKSPITRISIASGDAIPLRTETNTKAPVILVSVQGFDEVSAFCILTGVCRGVFKVLGSSGLVGRSGEWTKVRRSPRKSFTASKGSAFWGSHPTRKGIVNPLSLPALRVYILKQAGINKKFQQEFLASKEKFEKETRGINAFLLHERRSLITAGRDRIIRFWHLKNTQFSRRITKDFLGPYNTKYSIRVENTTPIYEEQLVRHLYASQAEFSPNLRVPKGTTNPSKTHEDQITDLKTLAFPRELLISSDAQGVINVWR